MNHSLDALINVLVKILICEHLATDSMTNPELTTAKCPCVATEQESATVRCHAGHKQDILTLQPLDVSGDSDE